ncbi:unnamed protein product, partial [Medioppia subpectinata]
ASEPQKKKTSDENFETNHEKCSQLSFSDTDIETALNRAEELRNRLKSIENDIQEKRLFIDTTVISAAARHLIPSQNKHFLREIHENQRLFEEVSRHLIQNRSLSREEALSLKHNPRVESHKLIRVKRQTCRSKQAISCPGKSRFRTPDGSCNNVRNTRWGKSFECIARLLDPEYADGVSVPRVARSGRPLPNPRILSVSIHAQEDVSANYTHMLMQFGQFLDHDISLTPVTQLRSGGIQCCPRPTHPDCFEIPILPNDAFYNRMGKRCINFVRSVPCESCTAGARLQLNEQHNRVASALKQLNPTWDSERVFQESRRIIGAQMQMITYNEFLPIVLGPKVMQFYKIGVNSTGFTKYDPAVNPSILSEFSSAAFRFGHSIVNGRFTMISASTPSQKSSFNLRDNFFTPTRMHQGQMDFILRGLVGRSAQRFDPFCHGDLRNHLYQPRGQFSGADLPAMNIQRGRDHGLPGYVHYLKFCFNEVITRFDQLDQYMPSSQRQRFQQNYQHVEDIDLFSGGISELPMNGAIVGPTFACIIGTQFNHLKYGDRFYFEHEGQDGSFTSGQLQAIRKTLFSRIICINGDNFKEIHSKVFQLNSDRTCLTICLVLSSMCCLSQTWGLSKQSKRTLFVPDDGSDKNYGNNKPNINYTSAPYAGPIPVHYPIPAAPVQVRPPVAPAYGSYGVNPGLQNYMRVMYGAVNYNYRAPNYQRYNTTAPQFNYGKAYNQSNNYLSGSPGGGGNGSGGHQYNRTNIRSPYQNIPGTYSPGSYGKQQYFSGKRYTAQSIYGSYLSTGAYLYHSGACAQHYSRAPEISQQDMESAFDYAYHQLRDYDRQFGNYSLFTSQSPPLKLKEKEAVLMEYVTEYLAKFKCLSKYQTTTFLPTVSVGQQYFRNRLGDTSCYSSYGGQGWTLQCPDFNNKYR